MNTIVTHTAKWLELSWCAMPRKNTVNWDKAADAALKSLAKDTTFSVQNHRDGYTGSLWDASYGFHSLTRNGIGQTVDLWRGDHNVEFSVLDRNHKLNITALLLSCNISKNIEELSAKGNLALPARNEQDLEHWMTTKTNWFWNDRRHYDTASYKLPLFNKTSSVESSVRFTIENAWRNLRDSYFEPAERGFNIHSHTWPKTEIPGLRWENTAICAIDAVYKTIHRLDEAKDTSVIIGIADRLHKLMIKHKLWGDDTNNLDRSDRGGNPLSFDRLSEEMKEYYILIALAALSGISDRMHYETVKLGKPTFAFSPASGTTSAEDDFKLTLEDSK